MYTNTVLANAMREMFRRLSEQIRIREPINVFLAGGMAVHLYTAERNTGDIDAEFCHVDPGRRLRIQIPADLSVEVVMEDGKEQSIFFDTNYNSSFALMHENYMDDATPLGMGVDNIRVHVLSPVDLAVSKISRLADNDRQDIAALVRCGLTTSDAIERRANEALPSYIGNEAFLQLNIRDAVALAREAESVLVNAPQARGRSGIDGQS